MKQIKSTKLLETFIKQILETGTLKEPSYQGVKQHTLKKFLYQSENKIRNNKIIWHNIKELIKIPDHAYTNFFRRVTDYASYDTTIPNSEKIEDYTDKQLKGFYDLVNAIPSLINNTIKEFVGKGAFKYVYLLSNDHVLGLFSSQRTDEMEIYKKFHDKQFSGTAKLHEPAIYDYGKVVVPVYVDGPIVTVYYVEMGKIISIRLWSKITNRDYHKLGDDFITVKRFVTRFINIVQETDEFTKLSTDQLVNLLKKASLKTYPGSPYRETLNDTIASYVKEATHVESMSFAETLLRIAKEHGEKAIEDTHMGNFGVSIQNPEQIILFDF